MEQNIKIWAIFSHLPPVSSCCLLSERSDLYRKDMTTGIFSQNLLWLLWKGERESIGLPECLRNSFVIFMLSIFAYCFPFFFDAKSFEGLQLHVGD